MVLTADAHPNELCRLGHSRPMDPCAHGPVRIIGPRGERQRGGLRQVRQGIMGRSADDRDAMRRTKSEAGGGAARAARKVDPIESDARIGRLPF